MNEIEKQMMLQKLKSVYWFMIDSSGKMDFENKTLWDQITDLDQENGDYRDVIVEIYFTDGKYIQLHNRSFKSLINNDYSGDDIRLTRINDERLLNLLNGMGVCNNDVYSPVVSVWYNDPETGITNTTFPISSVARISVCDKKVKWSEEWRKLSSEKVKLHETIFRNFRERYLSEHAEKKE